MTRRTGKSRTVDEPVDQKGLVKRKRVVDQTIFAALLMYELIELPEHEAAHRFMDALQKSGSSIPSIDPETFGENRTPRADRGDSIADKRMIFSAAFRFMYEECDEPTVKAVMNWAHSPYMFPKDPKTLEATRNVVIAGLRALSRYYGCSTRDPRRIIRSRVYQSEG